MRAIEQLYEQVQALEAEVKVLKEAAINPVLSEGIVQHIAGQIQTLFSNPVMLTGITSAILQNAQNALVFRAGHSKERQALLVVNKQFVPGSQRVSLSGTGELYLSTQQMPDGAEAESEQDGEWVVHVFPENDPAEKALIQLMQSYAVEADEVRYLITDVDLQAYRENLTRQFNDQADNTARELALANAEI
jgi:hypothetical protein